ncbi:hypothetical protein CAC42_2873 [Sphaceloma murrayae]|uniref:Uncharacterized protein n=1 Tax=Sphaceloma murrayae TaxID=2082308 RepID=A0A2K1R0W3_9PEZI|nr:hypothetical protein CAC42_2873 [Sphaceloma murrayae]
MTSLMPNDPNHVLVHNAAFTAQARRRHHSNPRIRHWLEDVMEQSRLSTPFIFDENDEPILSPLSPGSLGVKDNGILHLAGQRSSFINIQLASDFGSSAAPLNSKHSIEKLETSDSDSGPTFTDYEPDSPSTSPASEQAPQPSPAKKVRFRPNLTIKTSTPYKTRYTIAREQRLAPSSTVQSPTGEESTVPRGQAPLPPRAPLLVQKPFTPSVLAADTISGFPFFEPRELPSALLATDTEGSITRCMTHNYVPGSQIRPVSMRVPGSFPTSPTLTARNRDSAMLPIFVKTTHGVETLELPRMTEDAQRLKRVKVRMEKKSARMFEVAVKERARTGNYLGENGTEVRRRVLMEAVGRVAENALGFETYGIVKR